MSNRSNFGLFHNVTVVADHEPLDSAYKNSIIKSDKVRPVVIEGLEVFNTICPHSKSTGHRENPLSLLGLLTGADSQLLQSVLQELPSIASDPRLSDEDRVNYLVPRICSGTPAEQAVIAEKLMNDLDALGLSQRQVEQRADQLINFENTPDPESKSE